MKEGECYTNRESQQENIDTALFGAATGWAMSNEPQQEESVTVTLTLTMRTDLTDVELYADICEDPPAFFNSAKWTFKREGKVSNA